MDFEDQHFQAFLEQYFDGFLGRANIQQEELYHELQVHISFLFRLSLYL